MYSILEFLADVGGLAYALVLFLSPLASLCAPALLNRDILNSNFKYDANSKAFINDQ